MARLCLPEWRLGILCLAVPICLSAENGNEPPKPRTGTVQRRVLIFDFENQTRKIEFDYLAGSLADALSDSIKKTGKFRLMLREEARVNIVEATEGADAKAKRGVKAKMTRTDAIKLGHEAGADVVVIGTFNELKGVLMFSAQAYEADTRQLKVSEDILSKSDSEMFDGINRLADKIAESMAREMPMFDPGEAARRRKLDLDKIEERDWEFQASAGYPLLHPLYSNDGTINYSQSFPVQKLKGYSLGLTLWNSGWVRKMYFMPKESRLGIEAKLSLLTGSADVVDRTASILTSGAALTGVFASGHVLLGIPYFTWRRIALFADIGPGAVYTRVTSQGTQVFASVEPSALVGTSAGYHWSFWSLGIGYRAQLAFFSQSQVFIQHDFLFYAGLRI